MDKPDFLIYSAFGSKHLDYDCVRIFFTGENVRPDFNIADYAISAFDFMDANDRYLRSGTYIGYDSEKHAATLGKKREKFCCFLVTNGSLVNSKPQMRDRFYDKLSAYKRIDSGGRWRNNIGHFVGDRYGDWGKTKAEWLAEYKFNLCFENSSYPGYLTEKLFDAYMAGCIPIYWGDTSLRIGFANEQEKEYDSSDLNAIDTRLPRISPHLLEYKINPKAFINAHNFVNLDALVAEVRRIDNDEAAYQAMLNQPLFLEDFKSREFYEKKLLDFLLYIFNQSPRAAFRRGEGQHMDYAINDLRDAKNLRSEIQKLHDERGKFTADGRNIGLFISKCQRKVREFR